MEYKHREARYWEQRFRELEEVKKESADKFAGIVEQQYNKAISNIDDKIDRFIRRYAVNDKLSISEATKYLTDAEFAKHKMSLEEYIRLGQENAVNYSTDVARDLERASLEYRVTRLAALETELKAEVASIYGLAETVTYQGLGEMYPDLYGRTAFEIFKGLGVLDTSFALPNMDLIDSVIRTPWSTDGQTFSMHLWRDQTMFTNDLMDLLTQQMMNGESYQQTTRKLQDIYKRPLYQCKRVIYTESAFFQGQAQNSCYRDLGVEKYQFLSELNERVCSVCGQLDSKVFKLDERRIGVNAIPIHPNCRCIEVPYFEDDFELGYRSGRNTEGKSVEFPPDMTYEQWKKQVLDGSISGLVDKPVQIKMGRLDQQLPAEDVTALQQMVEQAPPPLQKIWNALVDKIKFGNLHSKRDYYSPYYREICINIDRVRLPRYNYDYLSNSYQPVELSRESLFHEMGHMFDHLLAEKFGVGTDSYFTAVDNYLAEELIKEDVANAMADYMVDNFETYFPKKLTTAQITSIDKADDVIRDLALKYKNDEISLDELLSNEKIKLGLSRKPVVPNKLKKDFITYVNHNFTIKERFLPSDVYENALRRVAPFGGGHGLSYWKNINPGNEVFAEMFSVLMDGNTESIDGFKKLTPRLFEHFMDVITQIGDSLE